MHKSIRVVEPVGWITISQSKRIMAANPYAAILFGRKQALELCGLPINDFLPSIDELLNIINEDDESGPWEVKLQQPVPQIEMIMIDILGNATAQSEGYIVFLMPSKAHVEASFRELTLIKQENLDIMLSQVVHELRNPLAGIKTTTQLLEKVLADQETPMQLLTRILNQSNRIEGLLKMLAIYVKPSMARPVSVTLENLVINAVASLPTYDINTIKFDFPIANLPMLHIDPDQGQLIFLNLLQNAIEALPDGGTVSIRAVTKQQLSRSNMEITISDNGVGISEDMLPKVFTPFLTTKIRGLGLGLAIVGRLVAANDGSIKIESTIRKGTSVTLSFPIALNS